jgi:anaerobic selenocysteine-containing dehydrogenase
MKIKRRDFLRLGVGAGAAAVMGCSPRLNALAQKRGPTLGYARTDAGRWMPTTCQGCTTWCPAEVLVQKGRAVKVMGNRHSKQNDGTLCPKGHLSLQELYDPDRVKVPRKGRESIRDSCRFPGMKRSTPSPTR